MDGMSVALAVCVVLLVVIAGAYVYQVYKNRNICRGAWGNGERFVFDPRNCTEVCRAKKSKPIYLNLSFNDSSLPSQTDP